jgi:hypothetical protein
MRRHVGCAPKSRLIPPPTFFFKSVACSCCSADGPLLGHSHHRGAFSRWSAKRSHCSAIATSFALSRCARVLGTISRALLFPSGGKRQGDNYVADTTLSSCTDLGAPVERSRVRARGRRRRRCWRRWGCCWRRSCDGQQQFALDLRFSDQPFGDFRTIWKWNQSFRRPGHEPIRIQIRRQIRTIETIGTGRAFLLTWSRLPLEVSGEPTVLRRGRRPLRRGFSLPASAGGLVARFLRLEGFGSRMSRERLRRSFLSLATRNLL